MSTEKHPYRLNAPVIYAGHLRAAGDVLLLSEREIAGYRHLLVHDPEAEPSPDPEPAPPDPRDVELARLRPLAESLAEENRALRAENAALKNPPGA